MRVSPKFISSKTTIMEFSPIIYAIGASICAGIYGFIAKVAIEKKYDVYFYTFHSSVFAVIVGAILFFTHLDGFVFQGEAFLASLVLGVVDISTFLLMMNALAHLSSSLVFINYRVISSLLIILVGVIFFGEQLSLPNIIGFIIGFSVFFLLYESEKTEKTRSEIKKGILCLGGGILLATISHTTFKYFSSTVHIESFYFFRAVVSMLFLTLVLTYKKKSLTVFPKNKRDMLLPFLNVVFFTVYYVFFLQRAYALGDLSISYKIISYSVFIPILLSVIFYGEKMTPKRIVAIFLTMISIIFFMY